MDPCSCCSPPAGCEDVYELMMFLIGPDECSWMVGSFERHHPLGQLDWDDVQLGVMGQLRETSLVPSRCAKDVAMAISSVPFVFGEDVTM